MKKDAKHAAISAAQMLINANLSEHGRDMSTKIAAHLQFIDGYYLEYMQAMETAVQTMPLEQAIPKLMGEEWIKLSRTQQRQWLAAVGKEVADTMTFIRRFHVALSAQAVMIDQSESLRVQAETARLAEQETLNTEQDHEHSIDSPSPSEGGDAEYRPE